MMASALRRRRAQTSSPAAAPTSPGGTHGVLKWIIPSIGAFAAVIGFVAESAHQGLLGIDRGDLGVTTYVWSAAQFVRTLIRALSSAAFLPQFFSVDASAELWLLGATVLVGASMALGRRCLPAGLMRSTLLGPLPTLLLFLFLVWRLAILEMPLARVEHLLSGGPRAIVKELSPREHAMGAERYVLKRAVQFYALLLCERHPGASIPELDLKCQRDREYATDSVRLLLVSVALSVALLLMVGMLWRSASTMTALLWLSPLAFYCCVAPAYLYGKLVKQPTYDSALVQFKTTFEQMPPQSPLGRLGQRPGEGSSGKLLTAIVLGRDNTMLTLYVNQLTDCGGGTKEYEWVPWQVANSEVIAVREISRLDVIAERFKQIPCPDSPGPR